MGSGASSEEKPEPQGRYLVNGGNLNEKPKKGPPSQPGAGAAARARTAAHGGNQGNANGAIAKSNGAASDVARRRAANALATAAMAGDEEDMRTLTKNADPTTLKVLQLIQEADALPTEERAPEKIALLQQCYPLLEKVPADRFDHVAMMVYQKEGEVYHKSGELQSAKESYARAITLAEKRVARGDKDLYMVLKRYVLAMVGLARIWYEHERDVKGFTFVDAAHPRVVAIVEGDDNDDAASDLSSLASTLSSGGSVFSLNQEILKSMAPRPPRSQTGPKIQRVNMRAPHELPGTQFSVEDEITLRSKMTRELVASPCELLLLRCCEVVELGHNCQSELLIPPTIELAQIYEDLQLYSRALLLVRKCLGILCNVFDYDHPWVIELMGRADRLNLLLEEQQRNEAATKIQATYKMHRAMNDLEDALGHPAKRHVWIPRKYRTTPEMNFLDDFVNDMPMAEDEPPLDDDNNNRDDDGLGPLDDDVIELPYVPEDARGPDGRPVQRGLPFDEPEDPAAGYPPYLNPDDERPYPGDAPDNGDGPRESPVEPVVVYDPTVHDGDVVNYTTMVPNARVVGTTQDTETDTHVQPTEFGDVVTVRTTTVTKTITEKLDSDPDTDADDENDDPLPKPHCPRCLEEQPNPVCPACLYEHPPLRCVNCDRALPFPDPVDLRDPVAAYTTPWPPQPVCEHCHVRQPARPPVPEACPQCRAPQSQAPLTCPYCVPAICPRCEEEQPAPTCPTCHHAFPALRCVNCARALPFPDPVDPRDPDSANLPWPPQPICQHCHVQQPAGYPVPPVCPECHTPQSQEPLTCLFCSLPHCPRCHEAQPPPACPTCHVEFAPPRCVTCHLPMPLSAPLPPRGRQTGPSSSSSSPSAPPPSVTCEHCRTPQPYTPPRPSVCPVCRNRVPWEPYLCPSCGHGDPEQPAPADQPRTRAPVAPAPTTTTSPPPLCPRCHAPQPAPACRECGCELPPPSCVSCHRSLPPPDPTTTAYGQPWPQDPRQPARLPPRPVCQHCGTTQPLTPPVPLSCPRCHASQPPPPPTAACPYCGFGAPEPRPVPHRPSEPRGPPSSSPTGRPTAPSAPSNGSTPQRPGAPRLPPRCPSCNLAQPAPKCEACGYVLPPPHCPHCYAKQPYPAPCDCDDSHADHPNPPPCWQCGMAQPSAQQQLQPDARRPRMCPRCQAGLPTRPPPCPYCGFGEPYEESAYYPEPDNAAPSAPPPHAHQPQQWQPSRPQPQQQQQQPRSVPARSPAGALAPLPSSSQRPSAPHHTHPHPPSHSHPHSPPQHPPRSGNAPPRSPEHPLPVSNDPTAPPRCPQCHLAQPAPMCEECGTNLPHPVCPYCDAKQPYPTPGEADNAPPSQRQAPRPCVSCGFAQPPVNAKQRNPLRCPTCYKLARPEAAAPPCPFCAYGAPRPETTPAPSTGKAREPYRRPPSASSSAPGAPAGSGAPLPYGNGNPRVPSSSNGGGVPHRPSSHKGIPGRYSPMEDLLATQPSRPSSQYLPPVSGPRRPSSTPSSQPRNGALAPYQPSHPNTINNHNHNNNPPNSMVPTFRVVRNYTVEKTRIKRKYSMDKDEMVDDDDEGARDLSISTPNEPNFLPPLEGVPAGPEDVQVQKETKLSADGRTKTVTTTTTRRFAAPEGNTPVYLK